MPKTIYHYHPKTGEYLCAGVADSSPLEADAWLLPACTTTAAPPAAGARKVALYRDADGNVPADHTAGDWQLLPDWRGVALYATADGTPLSIDTIGVTPADIDATELPRPKPCHAWSDGTWVVNAALQRMQVETTAAVLYAAINTERDRREAGTFPYRGRAIDCDPRAVQRITTAAMAAQAALATGQAFSLDWTCADNSLLQLDAAGVIGMPLALAAFADELHQHARMLKQKVAAAVDEVALAAIDIHADWPEE